MENIKLITKRTYEDYHIYFSSFSLEKLIKDINWYETNIINVIEELIQDYLKYYGFIKNDKFFIKLNKYHLKFSINIIRRECVIIFETLLNKNKKQLSLSKELNTFGKIGFLSLLYSEDQTIDYLLLLEIIYNQISNYYTALEQVFLDKFEKLTKEVFRPIYGLLEGKLKILGKSQLNGRIWFLISKEDLGLYFFDRDRISEIIKFYKKTQHEEFSPYQLLIWLISSKLPYKQSLAFEAHRQKKYLRQSWDSVKYQNESPELYYAEYLLYNSENYTANTLFQKDEYFFVVGFPTEIEDEVIPIINELKDTIEQYFSSGMKHWSFYLSTIKYTINKIENYESLIEIGTSLIAKLVAELFKKTNI